MKDKGLFRFLGLLGTLNRGGGRTHEENRRLRSCAYEEILLKKLEQEVKNETLLEKDSQPSDCSRILQYCIDQYGINQIIGKAPKTDFP